MMKERIRFCNKYYIEIVAKKKGFPREAQLYNMNENTQTNY
jgi:hypothetical protein